MGHNVFKPSRRAQLHARHWGECVARALMKIDASLGSSSPALFVLPLAGPPAYQLACEHSQVSGLSSSLQPSDTPHLASLCCSYSLVSTCRQVASNWSLRPSDTPQLLCLCCSLTDPLAVSIGRKWLQVDLLTHRTYLHTLCCSLTSTLL